MKRIFSIVIVIILFITSSLIFWSGLAPKSFSNFFAAYPEISKTIDISLATTSESILSKNGQVIIGENSWNVEIANSDTDRVSGLSNRKALHNKTGLLFAFDRSGQQSFWMKDMLIPIDMIFFDADWKIVLIEQNLQPNSFPKIFGNNVKSQYVLEVNANESNIYNLEVGNQAIFINK